ncbi:MAG: amino acid decarboxylase [Oscillibacter sp.]|nr:amino acid decarboxylase [Oscillibacter sp.]
METPIADFVRRYAESGAARFHMPGHKGAAFLGCEPFDITEISGAGELYEDDAESIIAQSERNAAALFGASKTCYVTEGSSQCVRAMVYLALSARPDGVPPVIVAARNAHRALLYAAALCGAEIVWLYPETRESLCRCAVTPEGSRRTLEALPAPPAAVWLTSPDYLGGLADIAALAEVCRAFGAPLLVDNAHGAYLRFLEPSQHPLDLGADMCCDSAHKTFPVLTGGAYLHIRRGGYFERVRGGAKAALALFGSTSPSWLTLASLDLCNRCLSDGYKRRLSDTIARLDALREALRGAGWAVEEGDPLRLTLRGDAAKMKGRLREGGVEWEYADRDFLVLMAAPENAPGDFGRVSAALGANDAPEIPPPALPLARAETVLSPREAIFAPRERVSVEQAIGRICAAPLVSCPPAIPIAASGERIPPDALPLFRYYGIQTAEVVRE